VKGEVRQSVAHTGIGNVHRNDRHGHEASNVQSVQNPPEGYRHKRSTTIVRKKSEEHAGAASWACDVFRLT
jgi:hypothetical protein